MFNFEEYDMNNNIWFVNLDMVPKAKTLVKKK